MAAKGKVTKQYVIAKIIEHVHLNGFSETSINDIIAITGVKKGNLYFHFKNKEELILEALKEAHKQYMEYLSYHTQTEHNPLNKIIAMLDAVYAYHIKRKFRGGCIFGNTALEMADKSSTCRKFIHEVFVQWIEWIATNLEAAVAKRLLIANTPVQELSNYIVAALEGGILLSKVTKKPENLHYTIQSIKGLLASYRTSKYAKRRM